MAKSITIKGVVWTKDSVKSYIQTSDKGMYAALLRIYSFQTKDEQTDYSTKYINGVGFSGADAEILSSFAKQLKDKGWLSPKQTELARKRLVKYAGQLFNYMIETHKETPAPVKVMSGVSNTVFNFNEKGEKV